MTIEKFFASVAAAKLALDQQQILENSKAQLKLEKERLRLEKEREKDQKYRSEREQYRLEREQANQDRYVGREYVSRDYAIPTPAPVSQELVVKAEYKLKAAISRERILLKKIQLQLFLAAILEVFLTVAIGLLILELWHIEFFLIFIFALSRREELHAEQNEMADYRTKVIEILANTLHAISTETENGCYRKYLVSGVLDKSYRLIKK